MLFGCGAGLGSDLLRRPRLWVNVASGKNLSGIFCNRVVALDTDPYGV